MPALLQALDPNRDLLKVTPAGSAYTYEAQARGGRYTWRRVGDEFTPGPVVLTGGVVKLDTPTSDLYDSGKWGGYFYNLLDADAGERRDDVEAWAYAAAWWAAFAEAWHARAEAKGETYAGLDTPWGGYIRVQHRSPTALYGEGEELWVLGGHTTIMHADGEGDSVLGISLLADKTWPQYFVSMKAAIVAKALTNRISALIGLQMALRSVAQTMWLLAEHPAVSVKELA